MAFSRNHVAVVGAVLGLTLAACSDDDSSDPTTPSIPAPPSGGDRAGAAHARDHHCRSHNTAAEHDPSRNHWLGSPSTVSLDEADEGTKSRPSTCAWLDDVNWELANDLDSGDSKHLRGTAIALPYATRRTTENGCARPRRDGRAQRPSRSRRPRRSGDHGRRRSTSLAIRLTREALVTVCEVGQRESGQRRA